MNDAAELRSLALCLRAGAGGPPAALAARMERAARRLSAIADWIEARAEAAAPVGFPAQPGGTPGHARVVSLADFRTEARQ